VIFDLDDTLVEKEQIFVDAQKAMLQKLNLDPEKQFAVLREIDHELVLLHGGNHSYESWKLAQALWLHVHEGKSLLESAALAFHINKDSIINQLIFDAAKQHDFILKNSTPKIRYGVKKLLSELQKDYILILFSSWEKEAQHKVICSLKFDKIFDAIIIRRKKNKASMLAVKRRGEELLQKVGGKSERMVMVGDRMSQDIIPAKAVGLETIWIPGPYYPGKREECPPDHEVSKLSEVLKILECKR
jgi:FMN phosphatase YigB (HAD superfamily)